MLQNEREKERTATLSLASSLSVSLSLSLSRARANAFFSSSPLFLLFHSAAGFFQLTLLLSFLFQ